NDGMYAWLAAFIIFTWSSLAAAEISIPTNLSANDRQEALRILGLGTSSKMLSNPYPLGGYSGFEFGLTIESVPVEEISRLGAKLQPGEQPEKTFNYPKFAIGKGLYKDIDVFLHFIPYNQNTNMSDYGGMLRYCFYQAAFLPASFSILVHANNSNVGNLIFTQSAGAELVTGINVSDFALYVGAGRVFVTGKFVASLNAAGSNPTPADETDTVSSFHSFIGGSFDFEPVFVAFQIDQYTQTVMGAKLGLRF
ncbi:MAG TPA: hypothetical protein VFV50_17305, partial [Bdellovibrionales bacterium]|nr:hypothetical protein [Bdellovibrionales bacterium]